MTVLSFQGVTAQLKLLCYYLSLSCTVVMLWSCSDLFCCGRDTVMFLTLLYTHNNSCGLALFWSVCHKWHTLGLVMKCYKLWVCFRDFFFYKQWISLHFHSIWDQKYLQYCSFNTECNVYKYVKELLVVTTHTKYIHAPRNQKRNQVIGNWNKIFL